MSRYSSSLTIESRLSREDFAPDGNLKKDAWEKAEWVAFDHDWAGRHRYAKSLTRVACCWTPRFVYLAYWCRYSALNVFKHGDPSRDTMGLWNRDVVEAFLNPDPKYVNQYYEFEVAPNNLWIDLKIDLDRTPPGDASWNSGYAHATRVGRSVWACEMRIPVAPMAGSRYRIQRGVEWRGNFFRADGAGGGAERRLLAWSPTMSPKPNFHVPTRFGLIRFIA